MENNRYYAPATVDFEKLPGYPSIERMEKGPVAVVECNQNIPCNPCENVCPKGAIKVGSPITNLPNLEENLCIGCGLCVAACPGQAIFVIDMSFKADKALVAFPYEYYPVPKKGDEVNVVDRDGNVLGKGTINKVMITEKFDHTNVVWVEVDKEIAREVHFIEV